MRNAKFLLPGNIHNIVARKKVMMGFLLEVLLAYTKSFFCGEFITQKVYYLFISLIILRFFAFECYDY